MVLNEFDVNSVHPLEIRVDRREGLFDRTQHTTDGEFFVDRPTNGHLSHEEFVSIIDFNEWILTMGQTNEDQSIERMTVTFMRQ